MKVKAINKSTNQQFDCEEIEIKGYKYYLYYNSEPKRIGQYYITKDNQVDIVKTGKELGKPILCSNNPTIDIPQVIDQVEKLAVEITDYAYFSDSSIDYASYYKGVKTGYNKSQETHPFSERELKKAIEDFHRMNMAYLTGKENDNLNIEEFVKYWKEQQPKKVYYE